MEGLKEIMTTKVGGLVGCLFDDHQLTCLGSAHGDGGGAAGGGNGGHPGGRREPRVCRVRHARYTMRC